MITTPEELLDYVHDYIDSRKGELGIAYVAYGEEDLLPEYPAVIVTAEPVNRDLHGTHTFGITLELSIWVLHANLDVSRRQRTREDLLLVTGIRNLLHGNLRLYDPDTNEPNVIHAYVSAEVPGTVVRKSDAIVATRMSYTATTQARF